MNSYLAPLVEPPEPPKKVQVKHDNEGTWYLLDDGTWIEERWICHRCQTDEHVVEADERYSYGIYAGRYCDECWPKSGYRDAGREMGNPYDLERDYGEVIDPD